ncbi:type II toxin-antitoxin system Phd/YefM family antitoxin [Neisseria sp.]|uniref:type II toxin-antitoxin system Phd/YefM family antitoxin n=1 Tax=Neisseria sp. TaxID=192066 RepID=UPI0035A1516D
MQIVNIHEAKTHLSRLTEAVAQGERFVIAKAGKPVAQVVPYHNPPKAPKRIGFLPALVVPDDFDTLADDKIQALFAGEGS